MDNAVNTTTINFFGGGGVGKSTMALNLTGEFKLRKELTEYIPEYAKELTWQFGGNPGAYSIQPMIHAKQCLRHAQVAGKVDWAVTDSPTLLCAIYNDTLGYGTSNFKSYAIDEFKRHEESSINILLVRRKEYVPEGRFGSKEQAVEIDGLIEDLLVRECISFIVWDTETDGGAVELADYLLKYGRVLIERKTATLH